MERTELRSTVCVCYSSRPRWDQVCVLLELRGPENHRSDQTHLSHTADGQDEAYSSQYQRGSLVGLTAIISASRVDCLGDSADRGASAAPPRRLTFPRSLWLTVACRFLLFISSLLCPPLSLLVVACGCPLRPSYPSLSLVCLNYSCD